MVELRAVDIDTDLELIMAWRSDPDIYKWFPLGQRRPLAWEEHYSFWTTKQSSSDNWIILTEGRKVGCIRAIRPNWGTKEVDILVGEKSLWGKGIGAEAIRIVLNYLKEIGFFCAIARIDKDNIGSQKAFYKNGLRVTDREDSILIYKRSW